jgi:hypothetical protein
MDARRFDRFTKGLARHLPRRGLLGGIGAAGLAAVAGRAALPRQAGAQEVAGTVAVPCTPCRCDANGDNCQCCLIGISGGGIVRTEIGDATLVLFATELGDEAERQATGFVRWIDPVSNGGLTLESVGPITYEWREQAAGTRDIRGTMAVNGEGQEPFVLHLVDAGDEQTGDAASLEVGDLAAAGDTAFSYSAAGQVVGGDIQLLDDIAAVD